MLDGMKRLRHLFVLLLLVTSVFAEPSDPLLQARKLSEQGQSRAAISLLEPLVQREAHALDDTHLGIAWNLLGSAYVNLEDYDKARHCYETAIRILQTVPTEQLQYATALDNLATAELATDHSDAAKALRIRARRVYEGLGNDAGIAIVSSNLAMVNLKQNDLHEARQNLTEAFEAAERTKQLTDNNLAEIYIVKGCLANAERNFQAAVGAFQQAIDLWIRKYGDQFFMLGTAYALRGQAYSDLGDHQKAVADLQHALALLAGTPGPNTPAYFMVEFAYARALRDTGAKRDAARLEKEAKAALISIRTQQCGGCTISAESLRSDWR